MKTRLIVVIVVLAVPSFSPAQDSGGYFPGGTEQSGFSHDIMLIYGRPGGWQRDHFLPYVAYLDKKRGGRPVDWFYDGWLFLFYGGAPSGKDYISQDTTKADWEFYFNALFARGQYIDALDQCIAGVEEILGPRQRTAPAILMIPYPSPQQKNFGDVDGDGKTEDFSVPGGREKAVAWCIAELAKRWQAAGYRKIDLWGFYWMNEGIGPADEGIVSYAAHHIHQAGYQLHWIPWFNAPGCGRWRELGIDFAIMQPNYAFMKGRRDPQRLIEAAHLCRKFGMGIEIEVPFDGARSRAGRDNLLGYLSFGSDDLCGYMKNAAHAYYQGYRHIGELYQSDRPADNALYDALYRFAKGTLDTRTEHPSSGCTYRAAPVCAPYADDGRKLTDGLLVTDEAQMARCVSLAGAGAHVELDLGSARSLSEIRVHVLEREGFSFPGRLEALVSAADGQWRKAGESWLPPVSQLGGIAGGFMCIGFPPLEARYVRLSVPGDKPARFLLDEIVVPAVESFASDAAYQVSPPHPRFPDPSGCALTDGLHARADNLAARGVSWLTPGKGCIEMKLARPAFLGKVRVHAVSFPDDGVELPRVLHMSVSANGASWTPAGSVLPRPLSGPGGAYCDIAVAPRLVTQIRIEAEAQPGKIAVFDEVEAHPGDNLAARRPYILEPQHLVHYPDTDNRELTDGKLTERGFGDGRTVGWHGLAPTVAVDLGREQIIDGGRLHMDGGGHGAVNFPARLDLLVSTDGLSWQHLGACKDDPQVVAEMGSGEQRTQLAWMAVNCAPASARFVKFALSGPRGWVMLSEAEVLSQGRNVAADAPYTIAPPPTPKEKYGDTAALLTDGSYTVSSFSEGRMVGWNKGEPRIVVDLQAEREISQVAAHLLGGGGAGIFFPWQMTVATSLDGRTWGPDRITAERPPEPEGSPRTVLGYLSVSFPPERARFLSVKFKPRGWLMVDEIEVY